MNDAQIEALVAEIETDPLGVGYAGMDEQQIADSLMAANKSAAVSVLTGTQIGQLFDVGEFKALDTDARAALQSIWHLQIVPVTDGFYREFLLDAFKEGSTTWTRLSALLTRATTRAAQLGLPEKIGAHHVKEARSLNA